MDSLNLGASLLVLSMSTWLLLSSYGWGRLIITLSWQQNALVPFSIVVLVGLSASVWLLSGLSLIGLGNGLLATIVLSAGLAPTAQQAWMRIRTGSGAPKAPDNGWYSSLAILLLSVGVVLFVAPTDLFNLHDDFHTYLAPPIRLAQSGFLFNSSDFLQPSAYNGQAILLSVWLYWLDIHSINALELFLFFFLFLSALDALGQLLGVPLKLRLATIVLATMVNPQLVNVTALYSSSALFIAATYLLFRLYDSAFTDLIPRPHCARSALPLALIRLSLGTRHAGGD